MDKKLLKTYKKYDALLGIQIISGMMAALGFLLLIQAIWGILYYA